MTTAATTTTTATTACMGTCEVEWQDIKEQAAAAEGGEQQTWLPPGFRFHPTDEELVSYYLAKKVRNGNFAGHAIAEVDLNKCEPWDLPEKAKMGEKEWYFFSLRDRKYPTGMRTNRATEAGYWKATGKDRDVTSSRQPQLVGMKKTLVFYMGRAPKGEKTNWIMHEYRLEGDSNTHLQSHRIHKEEWVVCRIFQKSVGGKKFSSVYYSSDSRFPEVISYHQQQQLDETRSSSIPTPLMDHSPNPTVTTITMDDAGGAAAAANNNDHRSNCMSSPSSAGCNCFHNYCHADSNNNNILQASSAPNYFFNHKENTAPGGSTWLMKSSSASMKSSAAGGIMTMSLPTTMHSRGTTTAAATTPEMIHQAGGGLMMSNGNAKLCPNYELSFIDPSYSAAAKSNVSIMPRMDFTSSRMDFASSQQQQQRQAAAAATAYVHTNLMFLKSLDPAGLRAKAEPYCFDGDDDDEAQSSSQRVLNYGWGFEHHQLHNHHHHHHHPILNEQLNLTATNTTTTTTEDSICVTPNLFRYNINNNNSSSKFGFPDSSVDPLLECMFA